MKILVYIEPHPIRNWLEEFRDVGARLALAAEKFCYRAGHELRIVSNDDICDHIALTYASLAPKIDRLTIDESERLLEFDTPWREDSIARWLELTSGKGAACDFYCGVLRRVWERFPFDCVLLWSENGAVRLVASEIGALVLHFELGPTRLPFPETFYIDPLGTNGNASVSSLPEHFFPAGLPSGEAYVAKQSAIRQDDNKLGVEDSGWSLVADKNGVRPPQDPYVYVPLQLADDLNTLSHSRFESPKAFLEEVVPAAIDAGFRVVLKGHPASLSRPYNLAMEVDAIRFAKSFGDRVIVVPSNIDSSASLRLVAQSAGVITINSSVAFEARLTGKKAVCLGLSVFDGRSEPDANSAIEWLLENPQCEDYRTSWMMRSYFYPIQTLDDGSALDIAIPKMMVEHARGGSFGADFWKQWADEVAFGERWLVCGNESPIRQPTTITGWKRLLDGSTKKVRVSGGSIFLAAENYGCEEWASAVVDGTCIHGAIDEVNFADGMLYLRGWAVDVDGMRPPICMFVMNRSSMTVVSTHRAVVSRPDVRSALGRQIALRCGFEFRTRVDELDIESLQLAIVSSDNRVQLAELISGVPLNGQLHS